MNDYVANILAAELINLPFVTKTAGVIQVLKIPQENNKVQNLPVVKTVFRKEGFTEVCTSTDPYLAVFPPGEETGVIYFEGLGDRNTKTGRGFRTYEGTLKLVAWFDLSKIGGTATINELENVVMSSLLKNITPGGYLINGVVKLAQIEAKRPDPFDKYGLDEANKQYITHPNDYFSATLRYVANIASNCPTTIELIPAQC
jgi:hypothetical protein